MPITPLLSLARERGQEECYTVQGTSSQSTPNCASRSGVPSCVTVNGDSDEDFQAQQNIAASHERTPIKQVKNHKEPKGYWASCDFKGAFLTID